MIGGPITGAASPQPGGDGPHPGSSAQPVKPVQPDRAGQPGAPPAQPAPGADQPPPERWRTPAGLSAIAAIVGCLLAVVSLVVTNVIDLRPDVRVEPSTGQVAGSVPVDNLIFVYGSSQPGLLRYDSIRHYVAEQRQDTVMGYLYDSGLDYPIAKFGSGEPIPGWVLTIHEDTAEQFFTEMTRLENGLFGLKRVRTTSGLLVQTYEWIGPTDGLERIDRWPR